MLTPFFFLGEKMKVSEVIERYKRINEDNIDIDLALSWVKELEMMIYDEIVMSHEGFEKYVPEEGSYFDDWGMDSDVIADMPYQSVYTSYIDMQMYQMTKESQNFNAAVNVFQNAYWTFMNAYNRKHMPLQHRCNVFRHDTLNGRNKF